ncbi:HD domain-containing protein [Paractinoplanes hotanensis]|uniref:HD domain-containing protein n=1 Tax=Paractinoplanes hotanensis TaxID=2906497 RepID=A0ABT0YDR5_9ACTN|nr:HD domain-containing protein [Actinoplanes hotanensis]MCM4084173.1 HD domain-containing protein [Actinoplanes hotanensis]
MATVVDAPILVLKAQDLAHTLLRNLPERWQHSAGVAQRAEQLTGTVSNPADAATLIAAAWLHDIGYAEDVRDTGFHPLDGGLYLRHRRWPNRIASLVAHHSEALCVASVRGLADRLAGFTREDTAVADALTYADQTVGPHGRTMTIERCLDDMLRRHGPDSPNAQAHSRRAPLLRAAGRRVEQRLSTSTSTPLALGSRSGAGSAAGWTPARDDSYSESGLGPCPMLPSSGRAVHCGG